VVAGAPSKALGLSVRLPQRKIMHRNPSILYGEIINAFVKDKGTTAAFLDVKSAYDNVLSDILD
jgi:hypothetical protein